MNSPKVTGHRVDKINAMPFACSGLCYRMSVGGCSSSLLRQYRENVCYVKIIRSVIRWWASLRLVVAAVKFSTTLARILNFSRRKVCHLATGRSAENTGCVVEWSKDKTRCSESSDCSRPRVVRFNSNLRSSPRIAQCLRVLNIGLDSSKGFFKFTPALCAPAKLMWDSRHSKAEERCTSDVIITG